MAKSNPTLQQLHDAVKQHPCRIDGRDVKEYVDLLVKLADRTVIDLRQWANEEEITWLGWIGSFIHDFLTCVDRISWDNIKGRTSQPAIICHIESCLGYIHRFLDTGQFHTFDTYYLGSNRYKCKCDTNRRTHYEYDPEDKEFYSTWDEVLFRAIVAEIEDYLEKHGGEDSFILWNHASLDFYKKRLERGR